MYDYRARCAVAVTTQITRDAQRRHNLDPLTTIAFGRAVSCAALLASTLKVGHEYVLCNFASNEGPLQKVVAECNGQGDCRGYVSPPQIGLVLEAGDVIPASVGEAFGGTGLLTVTRGQPGQPGRNAVCEFLHGEIASDMARFLTESEQIPSAVAAGVKLSAEGEVLAAGGVLFQKLGGVDLDDKAIGDVEHRMAKSELELSERIFRGESTDALVAYLQGAGGGFGLLMQKPLQFRCTCSREKMMAALMALGQEECSKILEETGKLEMRCTYCGDTHNFRLDELTVH
jgi:molecular chaperone Hsp33